MDSSIKNEPVSLRGKALAEHPEFPWLDAGDNALMGSFLRGRGWLERGEALVSCDKAGEGNMNLTLRIVTDRRSLILKQARPWVEKYDHIPAPWDRATYEQRFYNRVASVPEAASRMPRLIAIDEDARVLLLEDLKDAHDFTSLYTGGTVTEDELVELAAYLTALNAATCGEFDPAFVNRDMRALNHEHIFVIPLAEDNGLEVDGFEPGLEVVADRLRSDDAYREVVDETADRYLADGPCLVHGDYFPGSWIRAASAIYVIDPEFCYFGDPEFDLGVAIAHLRMSDQPLASAKLFLEVYTRNAQIDQTWVARYAAIEVMRRIIGVAQLPIPAREGFRAELLEASRRTASSVQFEMLWE